MRTLRNSVVAGIGLCLSSVMASAAPISVGTWYDFHFTGINSPLTAGSAASTAVNPATTHAPSGSWDFTLLNPGVLFVIDYFLPGDVFELFNGPTSLGMTSPAGRSATCDNSISCAVANAAFSKGAFQLSAGTYSITGIVRSSPHGSGAGAFQVSENPRQVSEVPIPAALPLLAGGLGLLGWIARRNRRSAASGGCVAPRK
jgi:hypothetical protein